MSNNRNYNQELKDTPDHKYAYDFDNVLRKYMMQTFEPYIKDTEGKALESRLAALSILHDGYMSLQQVESAKDPAERVWMIKFWAEALRDSKFSKLAGAVLNAFERAASDASS